MTDLRNCQRDSFLLESSCNRWEEEPKIRYTCDRGDSDSTPWTRQHSSPTSASNLTDLTSIPHKPLYWIVRSTKDAYLSYDRARLMKTWGSALEPWLLHHHSRLSLSVTRFVVTIRLVRHLPLVRTLPKTVDSRTGSTERGMRPTLVQTSVALAEAGRLRKPYGIPRKGSVLYRPPGNYSEASNVRYLGVPVYVLT